MIPMHEHVEDPNSKVIEMTPLPEEQESNADFLRNQGIEVDSIQKQNYITNLGKLLMAFHNTTANPKRLELSHFTEVDVFKIRYAGVPVGDNVTYPSDYSLLQFYLKRNGKSETFNVEQTFKHHADAVMSICLAFN